MAKKKKVVITKKGEKPKVVKTGKISSSNPKVNKTLVFGRKNYQWVAIGLVLIGIGMLLMIGGYNENPAVWDESKIYGLRRTLLAPIIILTGLAVEMYAIFK